MITDLPENIQNQIMRKLSIGQFVEAKLIHDHFIMHYRPADKQRASFDQSQLKQRKRV